MKKYTVSAYAKPITSVYAAYMLTLFLLGFGVGGYGNITKVKYVLFLVGSIAYLGSLLLITLELAVINRVYLPKIKSFVKSLSALHWSIAAFVFFAALSTLLSPYKDVAWLGSSRKEGLSTLLIYAAVFFLVSRYGVWKKWYLWLIVFTLTVNAGVSLLQMAGCDPFNLFPGDATYHDAYILYNGEFLGTVGNADLFAALLCLLMPVIFVWAVRVKKYLPLLAVFALCLASLLFSKVAAGAVGMAACAAVFVPFIFAKGKKQLLRLYIFAVVLVICALCAVYIFGDRLGGHFADISSFLRGEISDNMGSGRIAVWRKVLPLVKEKPLFGTGPDTLGARLDFYFERYIASKDVVIRSNVDTAHNEYLNLAVNVGIPAALAYVAALAISLVRCIRNREDNITLALGAGIFAYGVQAFFSFSQCIVTPVFWLLWAMLANRFTCIKENENNV